MPIISRDVTVDVVIDVKSHFWVFLMLAIFFFRQIEKWNVLFEESSSSFRVMDGNSIHFFSLSLLLNRKLRKYLSMMNWKYICHCTKIDFLKMSRKWKKLQRFFSKELLIVAKQALNFCLPHHHASFLFIR